jgi:hypothetical protein
MSTRLMRLSGGAERARQTLPVRLVDSLAAWVYRPLPGLDDALEDGMGKGLGPCRTRSTLQIARFSSPM